MKIASLLAGVGLVAAQSPVKHVFVLVMENRSYDHMLGMSGVGDGLSGNETNNWVVDDDNQGHVQVSPDATYNSVCSPGHSIPTIREQVFGDDDLSEPHEPCMCGFVQQNSNRNDACGEFSMKYFSPDRVPVLTELAREFLTFDRWFCSVPGNTQPNRVFVNAAGSSGATGNTQVIRNFLKPTIFGDITAANKTWNVYHQGIPASLFHSSVFFNPRNIKNYDRDFEQDVMSGDVADYVYLEPRYFSTPGNPANDEHPGNLVDPGERMLKKLYETLRRSPIWEESALLITYDEHGGFYDHVPTPYKYVPVPNDSDPKGNPYPFEFDRVGIRVPTILVSPWVSKGFVVGRPAGSGVNHGSQYEHSSVVKSLRSFFDLGGDPLTAREEWAADFSQYITQLDEPRQDAPLEMPEVPEVHRVWLEKQCAAAPHGLIKDMVSLATSLQRDEIENVDKLEVDWETIGRTACEAGEFIEEQFQAWMDRQVAAGE